MYLHDLACSKCAHYTVSTRRKNRFGIYLSGLHLFSSDFLQHLEVPLVSYPFLDAIWCPRKIVAAHGNMDEAHVVGTQRFVEVDELRPVGDNRIPVGYHRTSRAFCEPEQGIWMGLEVPGLVICFRRCFGRTKDWHSERVTVTDQVAPPDESHPRIAEVRPQHRTAWGHFEKHSVPRFETDSKIRFWSIIVDIIILECILIPNRIQSEAEKKKQPLVVTGCYWLLITPQR